MLRSVNLAIVFLLVIPSESAAKQYVMENLCGETITMEIDGVYQGELRLDARALTSGITQFPYVCETTIKTPNSWPYVTVFVSEADLWCYYGDLHITDVSFDVYGRICGHYADRHVNVSGTSIWTFSVKYTALHRTPREGTASVVFTPYHKEMCYEHECDNGRCIHKDATCTGHNSCGDGSDCRPTAPGLSGATVAGLVIGCHVGLGILVSALVVPCCWGKRIRKKKRLGRDIGGLVIYTANQNSRQSEQISTISATQPVRDHSVHRSCPNRCNAVPTDSPTSLCFLSVPITPPKYFELYPELEASGTSANEQLPEVVTEATSAPPGQSHHHVTMLQVRGQEDSMDV